MSNEEKEVVDYSNLQLPFKMNDTVDGFLKALEDGTNEAKYLLTKECDLLLECKVCRSIYRSTVNFIEHKRHYCTKMYDYCMHLLNSYKSTDITNVQIDTVPLLTDTSNSNGETKPIKRKLSQHRSLSINKNTEAMVAESTDDNTIRKLRGRTVQISNRHEEMNQMNRSKRLLQGRARLKMALELNHSLNQINKNTESLNVPTGHAVSNSTRSHSRTQNQESVMEISLRGIHKTATDNKPNGIIEPFCPATKTPKTVAEQQETQTTGASYMKNFRLASYPKVRVDQICKQLGEKIMTENHTITASGAKPQLVIIDPVDPIVKSASTTPVETDCVHMEGKHGMSSDAQSHSKNKSSGDNQQVIGLNVKIKPKIKKLKSAIESKYQVFAASKTVAAQLALKDKASDMASNLDLCLDRNSKPASGFNSYADRVCKQIDEKTPPGKAVAISGTKELVLANSANSVGKNVRRPAEISKTKANESTVSFTIKANADRDKNVTVDSIKSSIFQVDKDCALTENLINSKTKDEIDACNKDLKFKNDKKNAENSNDEHPHLNGKQHHNQACKSEPGTIFQRFIATRKGSNVDKSTSIVYQKQT